MKRYDIWWSYADDSGIDEDEAGEWVHYEDAAKVEARLSKACELLKALGDYRIIGFWDGGECYAGDVMKERIDAFLREVQP